MSKVAIAPANMEGIISPQEKRVFTDGFVLPVDDGVQITAFFKNPVTDSVQAVPFHLRTQAWDDVKKVMVDSPETTKISEGIARDTFGMSLAEMAEFEDVLPEFEGYTDGDKGFFFPATLRTNSVTGSIAREIVKASDFGVGVVVDDQRFNRFMVTLRYDFQGETQLLKVSQLCVIRGDDEVTVKLNYATREMKAEREFLDKATHLPERTRELREVALLSLAENARKRCIENIRRECGVDILEMVENNQGFVFESVQSNKLGDNNWLIGVCADAD